MVGLLVGAVITWIFAPEVGGEYWPYIHVVASLVGGFIVAGIINVVGHMLVAKEMMGL